MDCNFWFYVLLVLIVIILIRVFIIKKETKTIRIDPLDDLEQLRRCEICGKTGKKEQMARVQLVGFSGEGKMMYDPDSINGRVPKMVYIHDFCRSHKKNYDRRRGHDRRREEA